MLVGASVRSHHSGGYRARLPARGGEAGQALLLLVGALCAVAVGALVLGAVARGVGRQGADQRAADLAALAGARAMHAAYERLFEPAFIREKPNPRHLEKSQYLELGRKAAERTAALNQARDVEIAFPDESSFAPVRIRATVSDPAVVKLGGQEREVPIEAAAEAELAPPGGGLDRMASGGGYNGPLEYRQGKPMRPDVAQAFDRMAAAAAEDGITLVINSGYRSDAEQAILFARNPNPKWVARPGTSLHRLGTELDLGPKSAYGWLAANAHKFGFKQRYSWEPWHFGYIRNAGSSSVGFGGAQDGESAVPDYVPARYAAAILKASQRWSVSAALLSAQLYAESNFNPFAQSPAGARGIAQFMPGTARAYGLSNPFDAEAAIDAQAHLMHDLLREFASVPLALAGYNAGAGAVSRCGCIPPYPETQGYVARILGLLNGFGDTAGLGDSGLTVRLVE